MGKYLKLKLMMYLTRSKYSKKSPSALEARLTDCWDQSVQNKLLKLFYLNIWLTINSFSSDDEERVWEKVKTCLKLALNISNTNGSTGPPSYLVFIFEQFMFGHLARSPEAAAILFATFPAGSLIQREDVSPRGTRRRFFHSFHPSLTRSGAACGGILTTLCRCMNQHVWRRCRKHYKRRIKGKKPQDFIIYDEMIKPSPLC